MGELHIRNSVVILMIFAILSMIFFANFIMPPLPEKMICRSHGGQWDTMLKVCAFNPDTCKDAGGISVMVPKEQSGEENGNFSNVKTLGCEFK